MLTVGQLARIYNVTTKTIRHYDAVGLFKPEKIGDDNNYRFYSAEQLPELRRILILRAMGIGIEVIIELKANGTLYDGEKLKRILLEHADGLRDGIAQQSRLLDAVQRMVDQISRSGGMFMKPRVVKKKAFRVVGMDWNNRSSEGGIPHLWERFIPREDEIQGKLEPAVSYGLCIPSPNGDFTYVAGFESSEEKAPQGMIEFIVPEQQYAVFTHTGKVSLISETFELIYSKWLPLNNLQATKGIDFELYDERFIDPDHEQSQVDIYVPITANQSS
jgi:predicted transcriptional regulator YdeE